MRRYQACSKLEPVVLSAELQRAKARYAAAREEAFRSSATDLRGYLPVAFHFGEWSRKAQEAYATQWLNHPHRRTGWDWPEIFRRYRDPDGLNIAMWVDNRLAGLCAATTSGLAVIINFLEGDPDIDCPLKGLRIVIALDVATRYAQGRGKQELRIEPLNSDVEGIYRDGFGFDLVRPRRGTPYLVRKV